MYDDGRVCISILHQPGDDPHGYETAAERWSPVHTVGGTSASRAVEVMQSFRKMLLMSPGVLAGQHRPCLSCQFDQLMLPLLKQVHHGFVLLSPMHFVLCLLATYNFISAPTGPTPSLPPLQVESIILSIISMLSSPNDESPANVDAAKQWREDRDGFKKRVARIVRKSQEML